MYCKRFLECTARRSVSEAGSTFNDMSCSVRPAASKRFLILLLQSTFSGLTIGSIQQLKSLGPKYNPVSCHIVFSSQARPVGKSSSIGSPKEANYILNCKGIQSQIFNSSNYILGVFYLGPVLFFGSLAKYTTGKKHTDQYSCVTQYRGP